jgi:UDP-hydrolysing UDP-N-acetyl-D-glucosamine 2-epimerase
VLGDRFEMLSAATAALPLRVPLAHIHGGEITEGALDDAVRHAMTKLSHLHFVATEEYAARVIGLGEEPWRVIVSGAPALDNLRVLQLMPRDELERTFELEAGRPFLLATWHPVTLQPEQGAAQLEALLDALQASGLPAVITYPNADMGSAAIIERLRAFAAGRADVRLVRNLGTRAYFSAMAHAAAMIGNSSSGIIEAASFQLPVVNIGDRQRGRVRGINVIDCAPAVDAIGAALAEAISPSFRQALRGCRNPYGDGAAAARIVDTIASVPLDDRLLRKRFHEGGGHPTPGLGAAASAALSGRA